MYVRGFAVVLSLFAIAPLLTAQSLSAYDTMIPGNPAAAGANERFRMDSTNIAGSLVSLDGHPIQNTQIQLQSLTTGRVLASVVTGINGSFEFNGVPTGDYEVVADRGVSQARERVHCMQGWNTVTLRMNAPSQQANAGGDTISVAALRVPEKARSLFHKAEAAFQKQKMDEAWKFATKALAVAPTYSEALTLRGILNIAKGDTTGGAQDLQASIKSDSNYPLAYFAMGALQNIQGHFTDAQQTLEQGLRVQPTSWQGYFELSKSMLGQSNYRSALKDIVRAEDMGVNYAPIYLVKAHALMGLKFYGDAATEFEQYLQLDPGGPESAGARKSLEAAKSFAETAEN
jgi:Flp pilus assembly protein TadD